MPSEAEDTDQYTYTNVRVILDTDTTTTDDRRESSSSHSTSAFISTPIGSFDNLNEMLPALRPAGKVIDDGLPTTVSARSVRRIGRRERTKSWAQQVQGMGHEHGSEGDKSDEDGLLKPPSHEPISRNMSQTSLEEPAELTPATRRISRPGIDIAAWQLGRRVRRTSGALSASVNATTDGSSQEEPSDISSAELGRRIIARERQQRAKRHEITERRLSALIKEKSIEPIPEPVEPTPKPPVDVKPKEKIVSIAELVNRHKEAMAKPTAAVKNKARMELGIAPVVRTPVPIIPSSISASSVTSKKSSDTPRHRRRGETPIIPPRTSSTPDAVVGIVPPRTSSKTDIVSLSLARSISDNHSTTTGTGSVTRDALLNQAALEQLELDDRPTSRFSHKVSSQELRHTPSRLRKERPSLTPSRKSAPPMSVKEDEEQAALAVAKFLRSPNLNRYFSFPRQSPDPPLRVSVAETGSLTGAPVLLFLGLGCVRFLSGLFDDVAKALDLRLICIDRWGYGKTDMVDESKRGLREWAAIVERVVDEMKVKQFSVLAHSAGCPYALAAANRMKERIIGRVHLLAPWVGTDVDNSYKWLKWVPNGIIKSATAAEWKLQTYFIGKPPPLHYRPIGYNASAAASSSYLPLGTNSNGSMLSVTGQTLRKPSLLHRASSIVLRTKNINIDTIPEPEYVNVAELTEVQQGILPMKPLPNVANGKYWKGIESEATRVDKGKKDNSRLKPPGMADIHDPWKNSSNNSSSSSLNRISSNTTRALDSGLSEGFDRFPAEMIPKPLGSPSAPTPTPSKKKGFSAYSYSYSYSYSRSPSTSTSKPISDRPPSPSQPASPPRPSFNMALQQASHAECEPGTTSDLLSIVLGRQNANRPWQYALNYADFSLPVKIYWGSDDDKISEKSVRWMEKTMTAGVELLVLEGMGHNLMTSDATMLEVFQSLAQDIREAAIGPQTDLRLY